MKKRQQRRHPGRAVHQTDADVQRFLRMRHLLEPGGQSGLDLPDLLQLFNTQRACRSRQDRRLRAIKQLYAQFLFHAVEIHRQRGLRDEQPLCGAGQILFPGDRKNIIHLVNHHRLFSPFPSRCFNHDDMGKTEKRQA